MRPRDSAEVVAARSGARRLFGRRDSVEVVGLSIHDPGHFTRLSPASTGDSDGAFRLAVLPLRIVALAVLWVTSSPRRALVAAAAVIVTVLAL